MTVISELFNSLPGKYGGRRVRTKPLNVVVLLDIAAWTGAYRKTKKAAAARSRLFGEEKEVFASKGVTPCCK